MRYCKTKIYAQPIPSMRDVEEAKCDKIMEQLDQIIENEDLTKMVNMVEAQINNGDYTAMDLAAAIFISGTWKSRARRRKTG